MSNPYSQGNLPPPFVPSPRGPGITRRPSYASVVTGQPASYNSYQARSSLFYGPPGQASFPASISNSYPPPPPFPRNDPSGDGADSQGVGSYPESWDRHNSTSFGERMATTWESRMSDFFVPSYLRNSRYIERLEERHRERAAALAQLRERESRSGPSSRVGSLSTTPSSLNLQRVGSTSHRGVMYEVQEKAPKQSEHTVRPLPSQWSVVDKGHGLEVVNDGLEVKTSGATKSNDDAASIRADSPVPRECGIYYYEVTLTSKSKEAQIGVGFSESKVRLDKLPGWESNSWAYHGDDGLSFCQTASGKNFGPKFGSHDVIGCGINFKTGQVFYTKNGNYIGIAFRDVKSDTLYPSVGMKKAGEHVKANFGHTSFVFDIDTYVDREKTTLREEIESMSLKQQVGHGTESSLLQEIVAQYLTHEGYTETARAFDTEVRRNAALLSGNFGSMQNRAYKEDMDAIHRQRIRTAILDGDIDAALKHTTAFYPSILQNNRSIYFKLRCRKFIEMIRKCTMLQPRKPSLHRASIPNLKSVANGHRSSMHSDGGYPDVFDGSMELDDAHDGIPLSARDSENGNEEISSVSLAKQQNLMTEALQYGQELRAEFRDTITKDEQQMLDQTFALIAYADARDSSLAHLLESGGRVVVAEELNSAILVGMGKASASAVERLVQQAEVLVSDLSKSGGSAALVNVRSDYMQP